MKKQNKIRLKEQKKSSSVMIKPGIIAVILTVVFFILALIGILNHEMWRDEFQAWLVARDADSLYNLYQNMIYEGNPMLWHILLYAINLFTGNYFFMQLLHILISTAFVYIFLRYSDFPLAAKILFVFGYFIIFEYTLISRGYGLGVLLVFIILMLYRNRHEYYIFISVILFLLANTTVYGLIISGGLGALLIADFFIYRPKNKHNTLFILSLALSLFIFILGLIISVYQIYPEPDNSFPVGYPEKIIDLDRIMHVCIWLFNVYFPIPDPDSQNFWQSSWYANWNFNLVLVIGICLWINTLIVFFRKPLIFSFYFIVSSFLIILFYYSGMGWSRYLGHLYIVLIVGYWLLSSYEDFPFRIKGLQLLSKFSRKLAKPFLYFILIAQVVGGAIAYFKEIVSPFSASKDAATFIRSQHLEKIPIVGSTDFIISPIASYMQKKIYYPERGEYGSFIIWDKDRKMGMPFQDIINGIQEVMNEGNDSILLILHKPFVTSEGKKEFIRTGRFAEDIEFTFLKHIKAGAVKDEKYAIYLVKRLR